MSEQAIAQTTPEQDLVRESFLKGVYRPPVPVDNEIEEIRQLATILTQHESFLSILKQELRGEQLYQDDKGERYFVQIEKPMFIKLDKDNKPIRIHDPRIKKDVYVCNEDAINEIINIIKMCGANPISPLTVISEDEIRADLLEMESKIATLLFLNRKKWGMVKSEYPVYVGKLKVILKDARYRAKEGIALKALRTMTSRIEQSNEQSRNKSVSERITSPFK